MAASLLPTEDTDWTGPLLSTGNQVAEVESQSSANHRTHPDRLLHRAGESLHDERGPESFRGIDRRLAG